MSRERTLAEIYPDEVGFMASMLVPMEVKIARMRQMIREQEPPSRKPKKYKGSKAAKRASRRKR